MADENDDDDELAEQSAEAQDEQPYAAKPDYVSDPQLLAQLNAPQESTPQQKPQSPQGSGYVTDPGLLALLNGPQESGEQEGGYVTDPKLLAQLNAPESEHEGGLGTTLREFAHGALPLAAAVGTGALAGSVFPGLGTVAGAAVGLGSALAGGAAASYAQEKALDLVGKSDAAQRAANAKAHPYYSLAGELLPAVAAFNVGKGIAPIVRGAGAILGGGLEAAQEAAQGHEFDPTRIAANAATMGTFVSPNRLGRAIAGVGERLGERIRPGRPDQAGTPEAPVGAPAPAEVPGELPRAEQKASAESVGGGTAPLNSRGNATVNAPPIDLPKPDAPGKGYNIERGEFGREGAKEPEGSRQDGQIERLDANGVSEEQVAALLASHPSPSIEAVQQGAVRQAQGQPVPEPQPPTAPAAEARPVPPEVVTPPTRGVPPRLQAVIDGAVARAGQRPVVREPTPEAMNASRNPNGPYYVDPSIPPELERFGVVHEEVERSLVDKGMKDARAHELATAAERKAVEAAGVDWKQYEAEWRGKLVHTEAERKRPKVMAEQPADKYVSTEESLGKPAAAAEQKPGEKIQIGQPPTDIERAAVQGMFNKKLLNAKAKELGLEPKELFNQTRDARRQGAWDRLKELWKDTHGSIPIERASPPERAKPRAYQSAPDALMGFRRNGPNRSFDETKYPFTQDVRITFPDGDSFVDSIKGMNAPHAIERAFRNWPGAEITPLQIERAPLPERPESERSGRVNAPGAIRRFLGDESGGVAITGIGGGGKEPSPEPSQKLLPKSSIADQAGYRAALKADEELHKLTTIPAADVGEFSRGVKEAAKMHPLIEGKGGEDIYKAIEKGDYAGLATKLKQGYEHATDSYLQKGDVIRDELIDRKLIPDEPMDQNYIHRMLKNIPTKIVDPISEGGLPGMHFPSSAMELAFRGAEDAKGNRLVISGNDAGKITIWKDRKASQIDNIKGEPLKTGDTFTYDRKKYTVDRGITDEIEKHALLENGEAPQYHKNAIASAFAYYHQMKMMKDYHDWLDNFKSKDSPFKDFMTTDREQAEKRGWHMSEVPDLNEEKPLYLHPDLEQAIHNNYNPGLGFSARVPNMLRAINQFAIRSIFWNPVPHSMNALMHYMVARGWDWIPMPSNRMGANWIKSTMEGFEAAYSQNKLLDDLNRSGASLVMSKINRQKWQENIGDVLKTDLRNNPGPWEKLARDWGLGRGIDAVNLIYDSSSKALWTFSDALMASRIRELELNNPKMTRQDAIDNARIHMPDYRLPIRFLNSNKLVNAMSDKTLAMFGRYHMGVFNSLGHMVTDLLGSNATAAQRKEALGNVFALGVLAFIVKPALDLAVQTITGNKEAKTRPRGPLAPLTNAYEVARGKRDVGSALSNIFTFSPGIKQVAQTLSNRDFAGRSIVEKGSPTHKKLGQYADYTVGNLISPYGTFGPTVQPKTAKGNALHEILSQLTDIDNPTPKQIAGRKYGEKRARDDAQYRAKHPRGLIEYGIQQLSR